MVAQHYGNRPPDGGKEEQAESKARSMGSAPQGASRHCSSRRRVKRQQQRQQIHTDPVLWLLDSREHRSLISIPPPPFLGSSFFFLFNEENKTFLSFLEKKNPVF